MTQGLEANNSGKHLESLIERTFAEIGFLISRYSKTRDNQDMLAPRRLIKNVPYKGIYYPYSKRIVRSEFLADGDGRQIRIECKNQEASGSIDEKFPYLLENLKCAPEPEALIVLGGTGARDGAVGWLKDNASIVGHKTIWVEDMNSIRGWIRENFGRNPRKSDEKSIGGLL